ncbi:LOW QUALITY PROTEIN: NADH dehydrogenase [Populus alba x Populus x berolinensis]|uniref:NADH dehydrogenase n=2 Tax=Populus TaxID=3689 RepID=A0AAD6W9T0_9ROSI|nr:LOW QUALITY PROTEIN: NADH dehydrogenase [Populus alba x Populus x berolinensis]
MYIPPKGSSSFDKKVNSRQNRAPEAEVWKRQSTRSRAEKMAWRGHLSKNLKELRILLCQSSPSSSITRTFIEKNYKDLKTLNPKLPILIRECNGIEPQLWARYDFGVERGVRLEGLSEAQISKALEELGKAGASLKV